MRKTTRKLSLLLAMAAIISVFPAGVSAASVSPTSSAVLVDGAKMNFEAYNIGGSNYFKLRDLALVLNGTAKQFEVGYDNQTMTVTLTTGEAYTPAGGEMTQSGGGSKNAEPTASRIFVDGEELKLTVYNIGGSNYFKLRDIAEAIDCGVTYDSATGTIGIDTKSGYSTPPEPYVAPSQPAAASGAIITENAAIGGSSAQLVYIPMGGNRFGEVVTAYGNVCSDENQTELIKRAPGKVAAAVNGGFFASYYNAGATITFPDNYPEIYGIVMRNGVVINGGGETNAFGFTSSGKPLIDRVDIKTSLVVKKTDGDKSFTIWGVNKYYADAGSVNMFTQEFTLPFTTNPDSQVVTVKDGKVTSISGGGSYTVPAGASVVVYNSGAVANAKQWESFPEVGDDASFVTELAPRKAENAAQWKDAKTIVAGGRMILQNGNTVTTDDSYNKGIDDPKQAADAKLQRSFAAVMADGRLVIGTANASFNEIAQYLKTKNAIDAVSLDGGASSMLYVDGKGFLTNAGRKLASAVVIVEK